MEKEFKIIGAELFADVLQLHDKIHSITLTIDPESLDTRREGAFHRVRSIESSLSKIFFVPTSSDNSSAFIYSCTSKLNDIIIRLIINPPSIPTIVVARVVCSLRSARLVIDWHNLGYTLLALRLSPSHPLVHVHRLYEQLFSKWAFAHLCVTDLMRQHLIQEYGLKNVTTLMDRPPDRYSPFNTKKQALFLKTHPATRGIDRRNTKILVTSTSYTADEPLQPLLSALLKYSETRDVTLPRIMLLITGRGSMQDEYRKIIEQSALAGNDPDAKCAVKMVWLEPPRLSTSSRVCRFGCYFAYRQLWDGLPYESYRPIGAEVPVCAARFNAYLNFLNQLIGG